MRPTSPYSTADYSRRQHARKKPTQLPTQPLISLQSVELTPHQSLLLLDHLHLHHKSIISSWFTPSSTYHPIVVPIFALTICHSLGLLLRPDFKASASQILLSNLSGSIWTAFSDLWPDVIGTGVCFLFLLFYVYIFLFLVTYARLSWPLSF